MSLQFGLLTEIGRKHVLTIPDDFDLDRYCYDFCVALTALSRSATGRGAVEWEEHWTGAPEQVIKIRRTPLWEVFNRIYQYAEFGCLDGLVFDGEQWNFNDDDILLIVEWIGALLTQEQTTDIGFNLDIGKCLVHKFIARYKLDGNSLERGPYTICRDLLHVYLPLTHLTRLSLFEIALLSGVSNLRSIRNATYEKENPLKTIKEGTKITVEVFEARRWITNRRGFVPTPGINYD